MCGPLTPSPWTLHHSKLLSHTRKTSHLALECLRKKRKRELKKEQICMECDRMWNLRRFRWERHLPHIPKKVIPGHFSWKRKKEKTNLSRRKKGKITFASGIRRFYGMRCPFWSAMISEYVWWMRWHLCGVRWHLWSAQVLLKCAIFWVCVPRKANRDGQKFNSQSQPKSRQTHQFFFAFCLTPCKISLAKPFSARWAEIKLRTKTQVRSTMKTWYAKIFSIWECCL